MTSRSFQVKIYNSQLDTFKDKARSFASKISQLSNTKTLSAFKRNDYLAIAAGYHGHTDLIKSAGFRNSGDKGDPLYLFSDELVLTSIINTFVTKLHNVAPSAIYQAANQMAETESIISNINPSIKLPIRDTSKSIESTGWTVESVFKNESIENYRQTSEGFVFTLKRLTTEINIRLLPRFGSDEVDFELSHYIKTPEQISPYVPSRQSGDYYTYALRRAVTTLTSEYEIAIRKGHTPNDEWLHENKYYTP